MNRIVLIGNGFDLAHGLPTKYRDFLDGYWREFVKNLLESTVPYKDTFVEFTHPLELSGMIPGRGMGLHMQMLYHDIPKFTDLFHLNAPINSYEEFKQLISEVNKHNDSEFFLSFKNNFWQHISEKSCLENWFDIENEYYRILKSYLNAENRNELVKKLNAEFCQVKELLEKYLTEVCQEKVTKIDSIEQAFKSLIKPKEVARSKINLLPFVIDLSGKRYKNLSPRGTCILNFNYTRTAEKLYVQEGDKIVINIHGQLKSSKNPILFGYGDELDDDYRKIEQTNDNDFLENIKSIHYHNTSHYRRLLEFLQDEPYQVFVMGHSCGNSDRTLLNTLFEHENCISIKPFYHRWKDKETGLWKDNYTDLVKNISRNFNDKQNLRDIVVNKEFCTPLVPAKEEG